MTTTEAPTSAELAANLASAAAVLGDAQTILEEIRRDAAVLSPEAVADGLARVAGVLHDHAVNVLAPLVTLTRANVSQQGGQE
jgi:hypothetical protein